MPVVGHGRKPDHPLGPSGSQVFKAMKRSGWFEHTLSDARRERRRCGSASSAGTGAGRARQEGPRAVDLRLLGDRPQAVRLGQGHLPEPVRDRDQLSPNEPVSDSDDDERFVVRFFYVAIGFLLRNLWVWLHHAVLSSPHRGCRWYNLDRLPLRAMLLWLQEVAFAMYKLVEIALCERPVPERLTC